MVKIDEPEIFALKKNLGYFGEGRDILDSACDCHDGGRGVARAKHSHAIQHTSRLREIETDDPCLKLSSNERIQFLQPVPVVSPSRS